MTMFKTESGLRRQASFYLLNDTVEALDTAATAENSSRNGLVRQILDQWLEEKGYLDRSAEA